MRRLTHVLMPLALLLGVGAGDAFAQGIARTTTTVAHDARLTGADARTSGDPAPRFTVDNLTDRPRRVRMVQLLALDAAGRERPLSLHPEPAQTLEPRGQLTLWPGYRGSAPDHGVGAFAVHHYRLVVDVDGHRLSAIGTWSYMCRIPARMPSP